MYTREALQDLHGRGQRIIRKLLVLCATLSDEELKRELPGFGFPTVQQQLLHLIGAEKYWLNVVRGSFVPPAGEQDANSSSSDDDAAELQAYPDVPAIEAYRQQVAQQTQEYLAGATESELNSPREMLCWPAKLREMAPAHIISRVVTHAFQHQGQVLAMCRLLGKPNEMWDLDFPLD